MSLAIASSLRRRRGSSAATGDDGRSGPWPADLAAVRRRSGAAETGGIGCCRGRRLAVPRLVRRPLGGLLGPAASDAGQSLGALAFSVATTSLITGFTFALYTDTLRNNPGPAAVHPGGDRPPRQRLRATRQPTVHRDADRDPVLDLAARLPPRPERRSGRWSARSSPPSAWPSWPRWSSSWSRDSSPSSPDVLGRGRLRRGVRHWGGRWLRSSSWPSPSAWPSPRPDSTWDLDNVMAPADLGLG